MKKINNTLNILMHSFIGVFIGHCIYKIMHYHNNPNLYMLTSAPWYTSIQIYGICTLVIVSVCLIVKYIIKCNAGRNN